MNKDYKRETSQKSKTTKEILLTQEDKTKYNNLFDFLLKDNEDEINESPKPRNKKTFTNLASNGDIFDKYINNKNNLEKNAPN